MKQGSVWMGWYKCDNKQFEQNILIFRESSVLFQYLLQKIRGPNSSAKTLESFHSHFSPSVKCSWIRWGDGSQRPRMNSWSGLLWGGPVRTTESTGSAYWARAATGDLLVSRSECSWNLQLCFQIRAIWSWKSHRHLFLVVLNCGKNT